MRAQLVRGPVCNGERCFVDAEQWLAPPPVLDRDGCLEMLARRYLAGHGPATPADLAAYAGITLTDARRGFDMITAETRPVDDTMRALTDDGDAQALPPPRLLGMFDPCCTAGPVSIRCRSPQGRGDDERHVPCHRAC